MKKKLLRHFVVSLFVFTLFISVTDAEIKSGEMFSISSFPSRGTMTCPFEGYTWGSIYTLIGNYMTDNETYSVVLDNLLSTVKSYGYDYIYGSVYYASTQKYAGYCFFYKNCEVGACVSSYNSYAYRFIITSLNSDSIYYAPDNGNNNGTTKSNFTGYIPLSSSNVQYESCYSSKNIKHLNVSGSQYFWDGETYYHQGSTEPTIPAGPEFSTELTDDEIASVVENFSNSTYWKNRNSNYTGFFIQRNELNGHYAIMVVPNHLVHYKLVKGIYIPANVTGSNYPPKDQNTYVVGYIQTGLSQLPWNRWIESFKIYDSSDGANFNYVGEMHASEYMKLRTPMTTPIIYSNFTIPFKTLIGVKMDEDGEITDSFTEESNSDFSNLVNSETGKSYVFENVPVEDNSIIRRLDELLKDLINYLSSAFEFILNKIFNFSEYLLDEFGENVFTLIFAIIIEAFSVLVSGISLLIRFASFLLTLVAIPADSTLFNIVVDGNAWGTNFIDGLNFLKGLSWNNLNFWKLFECFVTSVEVIWFVRIIRRHYSQIV